MSTLNSSSKPPTLASFARPRPLMVDMPDGTRAPLRPLSLDTEISIDLAFDRPAAPMIKDPNAGSKAPKIENTDDPGYQKAVVQDYYTRIMARAAVGLDLKIEMTAGGELIGFDEIGPEDQKRWLIAAVASLGPLVSRDWLRMIDNAFDTLALPGMIAGAGLGNSSTPQTAAGNPAE